MLPRTADRTGGVATVAKAATALCARPPAHVEDNITPLRTLYAAPLNEHDLSRHAGVLHVCIPKSKCLSKTCEMMMCACKCFTLTLPLLFLCFSYDQTPGTKRVIGPGRTVSQNPLPHCRGHSLDDSGKPSRNKEHTTCIVSHGMHQEGTDYPLFPERTVRWPVSHTS